MPQVAGKKLSAGSGIQLNVKVDQQSSAKRPKKNAKAAKHAADFF
jgi:hypothetical protein